MTRSLFYILLTILAGYYAFNDLKKTSGFNLQKVLHILSLIFLLYAFKDSMRHLINLISNFNGFFHNSYTRNGILSPPISFLVLLFSNVIGGLVFISSLGLLVRKEYYRQILVLTLPFLIVLNIPILYIGFLKQTDEMSKNVYLLISSILFVVFIGIWTLYRSEFMKKYFDAKNKNYA